MALRPPSGNCTFAGFFPFLILFDPSLAVSPGRTPFLILLRTNPPSQYLLLGIPIWHCLFAVGPNVSTKNPQQFLTCHLVLRFMRTCEGFCMARKDKSDNNTNHIAYLWRQVMGITSFIMWLGRETGKISSSWQQAPSWKADIDVFSPRELLKSALGCSLSVVSRGDYRQRKENGINAPTSCFVWNY